MKPDKPPTKEQSGERQYIVTLRVTLEEREALNRLAHAALMSTNAYIRDQLRLPVGRNRTS